MSRSRSGVVDKSKAELNEMGLHEIDGHIAQLERRLSWLGGPAAKLIAKKLEVAQKVRDAIAARAGR